VTITGRFRGNGFDGEYRTRGCVSALTLSR